MSELLLKLPKRSAESINDYFDGARAGIRLYAVWKDGEQFVGCGRPLKDAFQDLENMRQVALASVQPQTIEGTVAQ